MQLHSLGTPEGCPLWDGYSGPLQGLCEHTRGPCKPLIQLTQASTLPLPQIECAAYNPEPDFGDESQPDPGSATGGFLWVSYPFHLSPAHRAEWWCGERALSRGGPWRRGRMRRNQNVFIFLETFVAKFSPDAANGQPNSGRNISIFLF